jgi:hypothetical protein
MPRAAATASGQTVAPQARSSGEEHHKIKNVNAADSPYVSRLRRYPEYPPSKSSGINDQRASAKHQRVFSGVFAATKALPIAHSERS